MRNKIIIIIIIIIRPIIIIISILFLVISEKNTLKFKIKSTTDLNKSDITTETSLQPTQDSVTRSTTVLQCTPDPRNYTFLKMILYCGKTLKRIKG